MALYSQTLNRLQKRQNPPVADKPLLAFDNVSFHYAPSQPLIAQFDWAVGDGQHWAILGPSGSGKTTLLYLLAGLRQAKAGQVLFDGQPIHAPRPEIGLMLQDYGLLPWYTARQNVDIGMKIRGFSRADRAEIARHWLAQLEVESIADRYPAQLSGGQRQRVALARLLALGTRVLLLDEPFSAVDELTRERLQKRLWQLSRQAEATSILVTHNVEEAALLADHIMIITDYAPIRRATIVPSPFGGRLPARDEPDFIRFCAHLREVLRL